MKFAHALGRNKKQSGFTVTELVVLTAVIGIVVLIGWYFTNKKANVSNSSGNSISNNIDNDYSFKELGAAIHLPDSLRGLTYDAQNVDMGNGQTRLVLYLTTKSYFDSAKRCYSTNDSFTSASFGAVDRVSGIYPKNPSVANGDGALLKQFSTFYIEGSTPNGITSCDAPGVAPAMLQKLSTNMFSELSKSFKTATEIKD